MDVAVTVTIAIVQWEWALNTIDSKSDPSPLADLGGGAYQAHATLQDPILSFLHTFLPKSACIRGPCPPMGNPGSATEAYHIPQFWSLFSCFHSGLKV